jgi:PAS domain S-box-containing protein
MSTKGRKRSLTFRIPTTSDSLNRRKYGILLLDAETGMITDVNPFLIELLGYSKDKFVEKAIWEIGLFKDIIANQEKFSELKLKGYIRYDDLPLETSDGRTIRVEFVSNVYPVNHHRVIQCNIRDISERKQVEYALKASERKFRSIFENIQDVYYESSLEGTILEVIPSIEELTNHMYKREELIGKSMYDFYFTRKERDVFIEELQNRKSVKDYEVKLKNRDNSVIICSVTSKIQFDAVGKPEKIIGALHNINERKLAELALFESEAKYRTMITQSPDGIFIVDLSGVFLSVNKFMCDNLKYSEEEFLSMKIWDIVPQKYLSLYMNRIAAIMKGEILNEPAEYEIKGKDGTVHFIEVLSAPFYNKKEIIGFQGIARDITERKQAEDELRASEEKFRNLFNNSEVGMFRTRLDGSEILEFNEKYLNILKYTHEEVKGNPSMNLWADKNERNKMVELLKAEGRVRDFECEMLNKQGDVIRCITSLRLYPETGILEGSIQDITESKLSEEALRKSEEMFRNITEQVTDVVFMTDNTGHITYISPIALKTFGYSPVEMTGQHFMRFLDESDVQHVSSEFLKSIRSGSTHNYLTFLMKRRDGSTFIGELSSNVYYQNDQISGTIGVIRDITERKKMEEELVTAKDHAEESDRLKSAFLANMSHEIRTPMNGILGFAGLMKEPNLTGKEQQEYLHIIEKSGARMLNIINDIVNISKIESGQMEISVSETNVNEQIEYIYTFFKPEVERKGMQLLVKTALSLKESVIQTDREKLYAILTNLVGNAIKFTQTGSIEIGCEKKGKYIEFFVKDTGEGIHPELKKIVFERFRQGTDLTNRYNEGSGLGLSISKAYIEMLGGKIWVESELGKGSIFYFTIPYNVETQAKPFIEDVSLGTGTENQVKELKILVVEDDKVSENLLLTILNKYGKEFLLAGTGLEAIETCRNNPDIDLILMDIRMPEMDGYEATRQIRQFNKEVVIIAQTAYGLAGDKEKAIAAGCNDYISKPLNQVSLTALVKKYLIKGK